MSLSLCSVDLQRPYSPGQETGKELFLILSLFFSLSLSLSLFVFPLLTISVFLCLCLVVHWRPDSFSLLSLSIYLSMYISRESLDDTSEVLVSNINPVLEEGGGTYSNIYIRNLFM